jgi:hypothetical protein
VIVFAGLGLPLFGTRLRMWSTAFAIACLATLLYWSVAFAPLLVRAQSPYRILINVTERRLYLYQGSTLLHTYPVAVGRPQTPTPRGEFVITQKAVWGDGFGTRWMRFSAPWGIYGIHGTNKPWSVGTVASHGCIRMYNRDVEQVYALVSVGTPVDIVGPTPYARIRRVLHPGSIGQDVVELQRQLRLANTYSGSLDGVYTAQVAEAVRRFQERIGRPATGEADRATLAALAEATGQAGQPGRYLEPAVALKP